MKDEKDFLMDHITKVVSTKVELSTYRENYLHFHLGIISEIGEFLSIYKNNLAYGKPIDREHLKKELGDILWFHCALIDLACKEFDHPVEAILLGAEFFKQDFTTAIIEIKEIEERDNIVYFSSQYLSAAVDTNLMEFLSNGLGYIEILAILIGSNMAEIALLNQKKLKTRFPEGKFSSTRALNRAKNDI